MTPRRLFIAVITLAIFAGQPDPAAAQLLDKLKKKVSQAKDAMTEASCVLGCGTVRKSDLFDGAAYESLAVSVFDGSGQFRTPGAIGIARDVFESRLLKNGYLLAADADAEKVRARMARGNEWTDEELAQLKEFVNNIDAVLVVDIRKVDMGRCTLNKRAAAEATVHLSARWVHVDAGDVPWVATHKASVCQEYGTADLVSNALEAVATQLTTSLPSRKETVTESQ